MNSDLYYAVLALDAYNRGEDKSNRKLNVSGTKLGLYDVGQSELDNEFNKANGFSAQKYTGRGKTVISYRGTDFDQTPDF